MSVDDDIVAFFADYAEALAGGDVAEIVDYFGLPLMVVAGGATSFVEDDAALDASIAALLDRWHATGVVRAVPLRVVVTSLPDDAARATVDWDRLDAAGATVLRFTGVYTLAADDGDWRIVVSDLSDEDRAASGLPQ